MLSLAGSHALAVFVQSSLSVRGIGQSMPPKLRLDRGGSGVHFQAVAGMHLTRSATHSARLIVISLVCVTPVLERSLSGCWPSSSTRQRQVTKLCGGSVVGSGTG